VERSWRGTTRIRGKSDIGKGLTTLSDQRYGSLKKQRISGEERLCRVGGGNLAGIEDQQLYMVESVLPVYKTKQQRKRVVRESSLFRMGGSHPRKENGQGDVIRLSFRA